MEFDARVGRREAPMDLAGGSRGVPLPQEGAEVGRAGDPLVEALQGDRGEEDLGDVEPAAVLRGVMNLEALGQPAGLLGLEGFVQAGQRMDVQVVHDQHDDPGGGRHGHARVRQQLLARFVQAHLRALRVVRPVIDVEHVLHRVHEGCVLLGRNAEAPHPPGLDLIFFRPRWTVLALTVSNTRSSTSLSANSATVHRARPGGGGLHARYTSCASEAPSSLRGRDGFSCGFRSTDAGTPLSQHRLRTRSTVTRPTSRSSAISWSVSPSSALSRMLARSRFRPDTRSRRTSSSSPARSSAVKFTIHRFFMPSRWSTPTGRWKAKPVASMDSRY